MPLFFFFQIRNEILLVGEVYVRGWWDVASLEL